ILGRLPTIDDAPPGANGALAISYEYWMTRFGGSPQVLGRQVRQGVRTLPIVGVLPPQFRYPGKTDLWFPLARPTGALNEQRVSRNFQAVGRLKSGISLEQAQAELTTIAARLAQQYPQTNKGWSVAATRMQDD